MLEILWLRIFWVGSLAMSTWYTYEMIGFYSQLRSYSVKEVIDVTVAAFKRLLYWKD